MENITRRVNNLDMSPRTRRSGPTLKSIKGIPHLSAWRRHRQLKVKDLAERLDVSDATISRLQTGNQVYTQQTLEALADALRCSPVDLLERPPGVEWTKAPSPRADLQKEIDDLPESEVSTILKVIRALKNNAA